MRNFLAASLILLTTVAFAQIDVRTLGGGRSTARGADAGFVDGNTLQSSQFNSPFGITADAAGNLYVADRDNGAIRKLDVAGNRVSTVLRNLDRPVAVAVDATNNLYVLTQGDGLIRRLDRFGNVVTNRARLTAPTALALGTNLIYATEAGGAVVRIDAASESRVPLPVTLRRPGGIAILDSGLLAVSETEGHRVTLLTPAGAPVMHFGTGIAGFRDGSIANAQFSQPHQLVRRPDGGLLVADRGNHRVRAIDIDGTVRTICGIESSAWEGPECLSCDPIILPGWLDGSAEFAEARDPVGVAVSAAGNVYVTEVFYHLVREVTGLAIGGAGASAGGADLVVLPPAISPQSGYFPLGQNITVVNPNTNAFFATSIYYTTDGTTPTTNSFRLTLDANVGTLRWRETMRDLSSLRLLAVVGGRPGETVNGQTAATNEIGVTRDAAAGRGATVILPVTVNLRPTDQLRSLQFRVEVVPATADAPMIPERFRALSVSTNDSIPVVTSSQSGSVTTFSALPYTNGLARGLAITFLGTNANLSIKDFGVVTMLAVPIPADAPLKSRYQIQVLRPSGTSDGIEATIPLRAMAPRELVVTDVAYMVGDSSPATWYNADRFEAASSAIPGRPGLGFGELGFGDRELQNSDVNNAFAAALGIRVPYPFSDLHDAMDAFPEDTDINVGGDGLIRFLDWQVVLRRSLGLEPGRWRRNWAGVRVPNRDLGAQPDLPAEALSAASGRVWRSQAMVGAVSQEFVQPGATVEIPIYVVVTAGCRLAGLAFRATMEAEGTAPAVARPLEFVPAPGLATPVHGVGLAPNVLLCGWSLVPSPAFDPPLENSNLLGHVRFTVPYNAQPAQVYTLRFANTDGSPDLQTQYEFETRPASVWVQSAARRPQEPLTEEWKLHYFGSVTNLAAEANADPDQDGSPNWAEYLAGTSPVDRESLLRMETPRYDAVQQAVVLRWRSAPGRSYTIDVTPSLQNPSWTVLAAGIAGNGAVQEWSHARAGAQTRFYRLRLEP